MKCLQDRNQEINFIGRPTSSGPTAAFAALGGTVQSTVGNVGLPNTRLTLIDTVNGNVNVVTTDANGDYEFEAVVTGAFYLVIAEREGYNFAPQIFEVNHFEENLNLDFQLRRILRVRLMILTATAKPIWLFSVLRGQLVYLEFAR